MKILSKLNNTGMIEEVSDKRYVTDAEKSVWNGKADKTYVDNKVKTDVPVGAKFTDTVYIHPETHPASMITDLPTGKKVARFVVGTSTAGWTAADCDYLCDGTADDTEINAAINALPATGGEVVILDGTYNITAKIDVTKNNVSIRGNGNATILKKMYDAEGKQGLIELIGRSGCKIANLHIEGNGINFAYANYIIYLEASSNNTITGNTCDHTSCGIYLEVSSNNTITGNTCNNSGYGIYLQDSSNNNTVTSNTCNDISESGIIVENSNNNVVTGNTCSLTGYGIYLYSSNDSTITGNTCNNNGYGIVLDYSNSNTVASNTYNNNTYGIHLSSSRNNAVTGNTCIRGTGLATDYTESQHTILLMWAGNNLISNNNCMGKAPMVDGGTGNSVYGNKYDSGDYKDFTQDEKIKLAGIAANASNYTHPTTAGNKHIPAGGASGQILRYSASGTAIWGADNDTITTINGKTGAISKADIVALGIAPTEDLHNHDNKSIIDKFTEVDNKPYYNGEEIGGAVPNLTLNELTLGGRFKIVYNDIEDSLDIEVI